MISINNYSKCTNTVLIIASKDDLHADAVESILEKKVPVVRIQTDQFPGTLGLTLEWGSTRTDGLMLSTKRRLKSEDIGAVWWRRPTGYNIDKAIEGETFREFAHINSMHAFEAFITNLPVRHMNDIWMQRRAERKGIQLEIAKQCGLQIPHTIISNEPASIEQAILCHPNMIYKSLQKVIDVPDGTKLLKPDDIVRLSQLRFAPTIFQEFIEPGFDLRIFIIEEKVYAAKLTSKKSYAKIDIRLDYSAHIEAFTLPKKVEDSLLDLMKRLGLVFGAIDMKVDTQGNYYFLEVNPAGQWIYIEMETNQPITESIACWLAGESLGKTINHKEQLRVQPI